MPDVSVFIAKSGSDIVGFKAGYAVTEWNYCSWLGGVIPSYRKQGIAWQLLEEQHNWLKGQRFKLIETHVEESNQAMIALNQKAGFETVGSFMKWGKPYFIMHREVV